MTPKFRAWHKELKVMCSVEEISFLFQALKLSPCDNEYGECITVRNRECVLMQSTGSHNKNGVEIFAGDIVVSSRGVGVVETKIGHAPQVTYKNGNDLLRFVFDNLSVIGNIYENPELLEQQNA